MGLAGGGAMPVPSAEGRTTSVSIENSTSLGMFPKWVRREIAWASDTTTARPDTRVQPKKRARSAGAACPDFSDEEPSPAEPRLSNTGSGRASAITGQAAPTGGTPTRPRSVHPGI